MRELLADMREGVAKADPEAIREAARKARELDGMLSPELAGKVSLAIIEARKAARIITARVAKAGETAADVVRELGVKQMEAARFAFLDLEEGAAPESEAPAGRGVDLAPESAPRTAAPAELPFALEI
jgi:hypothetical protein